MIPTTVVCTERDTSELPQHLSTVERIATTDAVRSREFVFSGGPHSFPPHARWTINGKDFDPNCPIASPRLGDVELWWFENQREPDLEPGTPNHFVARLAVQQ